MSNERNLVPRIDGSGSLGRSDKRWDKVHAKEVHGDGSNLSDVPMGGTMTDHIIPDVDAQYDLGDAEHKIRHLFLSDNSLWVGDEHKMSVEGGKLKFKKRKSGVPVKLSQKLVRKLWHC